mgnify:CR=1 FL=1
MASTEADMSEPTEKPKKSLAGRLAPLAVLAAGVGAFFALGLNEYVTLDALKENRAALAAWKAEWGVLAFIAFGALYALTTALSLPTGLIMTLTGGFLFGTLLGGVTIVVGATIGAVIVMLAARYVFGDLFREKLGDRLTRFEDGFKDDAWSYLLVLRLVPIFPFFVVNVAPAFFAIPVRTFAWTTLLGSAPGTFVYASVGAGIGAVFDAGGDVDLGVIFSPPVLGPLLGLATLSLLPVVYKKIKARKANAAGDAE